MIISLGFKMGRKTFCDIVLAMTKANALCGTMPEALELRDEIAFFQAIKAALTKKEGVRTQNIR